MFGSQILIPAVLQSTTDVRNQTVQEQESQYLFRCVEILKCYTSFFFFGRRWPSEHQSLFAVWSAVAAVSDCDMVEMAGCDSAEVNITQNIFSSPAFQRDYSQVTERLHSWKVRPYLPLCECFVYFNTFRVTLKTLADNTRTLGSIAESV